jgi:serine protease AprX
MKRIFSLIVAATALLAMSPDATVAGPPTSFDPRTERALVLFNGMPKDVRAQLARTGVTHAAMFEHADAAAVVGPASAYRAIAAWHDVEAVYPDRPIQYANFQATRDTRVDRVRVGAKPLKSAYTGRGVTIAIMDSGIDTTHPDLDDRVVANVNFVPSEIFDPTTGKSVNRDPVESTIGVDLIGHGTSVASVATGTGEAAHGADDMRGVAPGAAIVSLSLGFTPDESTMAAAYEWMLDNRNDPRFPGGIRVVNNSIALKTEIPVVRRLIDEAIQTGIVVVAASGNEGNSNALVAWPGAYPEVIAVGATCKDADDWSQSGAFDWAGVPGVSAVPQCRDDRMWTGSNRGPSLDVVAPGVDVWSAWNPSVFGAAASGFAPTYRPPAPGAGNLEDETNNRRWYSWSIGTSMSAPHVAGVVALMLEANPCLTPTQVEQILHRTAKDLGTPGFDDASGYGRVDALNAVRAAERTRPHRCDKP